MTNQDNDVAGTIAFSAPTITVGELDGTVTLTVTRASGSVGTVTVRFASRDATARAGQDYAAVSGTLTFAAGETTKTIAVPILAERPDELTETFTVSLSDVTGSGSLGSPSTITVTIRDVDVTPCETFLTDNVPVGTTVLPVISSDGCRVGDQIAINPGGQNEERATITGFGSIVIDSATRKAHAAGELVIRVGIDASGQPPQDDTDPSRKGTRESKDVKETETERQQRERTNRGGKDDVHTEGQVVAVDKAPDGKSLLVTVVLVREERLVVQVPCFGDGTCYDIQVGDYLEADGYQNGVGDPNSYFVASDGVTVRRNGKQVK